MMLETRHTGSSYIRVRSTCKPPRCRSAFLLFRSSPAARRTAAVSRATRQQAGRPVGKIAGERHCAQHRRDFARIREREAAVRLERCDSPRDLRDIYVIRRKCRRERDDTRGGPSRSLASGNAAPRCPPTLIYYRDGHARKLRASVVMEITSCDPAVSDQALRSGLRTPLSSRGYRGLSV